MSLFSQNYSAKVLFQQADEKYKKKEYQQAIELYTKAIDFDSSFSRAYTDRGLCYHLLKDLTKAETDYKKAVSIYEFDIDAHWNLGILYTEKEQNEDAIREFYVVANDKTIEINNKTSLAFYLRGYAKFKILRLQKKQGERNKVINGIKDLEYAISLNPENDKPYYVLSLINLHFYKYKNRATDYIDEAIRKNPTNSYYYFYRASNLLYKGPNYEYIKINYADSDLDRAKELGFSHEMINKLSNKLKNKKINYSEPEYIDFRDYSNLCPACGDPFPCFCNYYVEQL